MKIIFKVAILSVSLILIRGCKEMTSNNQKDLNTYHQNISDHLIEEFEIKVIIKDTIPLNKRTFGDIIIYSKLRDSIKKSQEDVRIVTSCLNLFDSNINIKDINEKKCDTFYQANSDFNKVRIPFYITPRKTGIHYLSGVLNEDIYLYAYKYKDTTLTRMVNFEHSFKERLYVKEIDKKSN